MQERKSPEDFTPRLIPGAVFNTPFENGCVVITAPNSDGGFEAYDSDKVICWFSVVMVTDVQ